jgi:hypothetical protein
MAQRKAGRNDPCPCGSGKKFKRCCEAKKAAARGTTIGMVVVGAIVLGGLAFALSSWNEDSSPSMAPGRVWSPEHGHYH